MKLKTLLESRYDDFILTFRRESNDTLLWYIKKNEIPQDEVHILNVEECHLRSIEGSPTKCYSFNARDNNLNSLVGGPKIVDNLMNVSLNPLISLEHAPDKVGKFTAVGCGLTSLEGIGRKYLKECRNFRANDNQFRSHILGLLTIKNLEAFGTYEQHKDTREMCKAFSIVNKHFDGDKDILDCQEELIQAGLKEFAKL